MKLEKAVIYIIVILFISNTIKIVIICRRIIDRNDYAFLYVYMYCVYIVKMMYIRLIMCKNFYNFDKGTIYFKNFRNKHFFVCFLKQVYI